MPTTERGSILGFIGVGVMGRPMARRLIEHGHAVVAYDASPVAMAEIQKSGAQVGTGVADVAKRAGIVFTSLPDPVIFKQVAQELSGVTDSVSVKLVVDLSTVGPRASREAAQRLHERGIGFVDAPVSGGAAGASKGTLAVMTAGKPEALDSIAHLLPIFGRAFKVGEEPGQAQLLKLLNNLLSLTAFAITSEAYVAGVKGGLDPEIMLAAINAGSGRSAASQDKFVKQVLPRTFDFGFPIKSVCKDFGLAVDECEALGVPMWVGNAVRQLWNFAGRQDGMQRDMTELVKTMEAWAHAEPPRPVVPGQAA